MPYVRGLTYAPSTAGSVGHLLFVREGTLVAQPFDEQRLELAGDAVPLAQQVGTYLDTAFFSASLNDVLVYRAGDPTFPITWYDRQGNMVGRVAEPGQYSSLALSPDGTRAVASLTNPRDRANSDLWLFDLAAGGSPARFTFNAGMRSDFPVFSPDGKRVVFRKGGAGTTSAGAEAPGQRARRSGRDAVQPQRARHADELVAGWTRHSLQPNGQGDRVGRPGAPIGQQRAVEERAR